MSPALRALVDADQQRPGPADGERNRIYGALGVSLGVLPAGALAAAHAASAATTTASATATATTTASATAAATSTSSAVTTAVGAASAVGRIALLAKAPLVSVSVGAVLGATLTAYVVKGPAAHWSSSARVRHAPVTAPAPARTIEPAPVSVAVPEPAAPPAEAPAPVDEKPAAVAPRHAAAPVASAREKRIERATVEAAPAPVVASPSAGALAAEQALLDPARAALAHGDGAGALARLAVHEHRFPSGALAQEREAMTIRALALTGERDHARARAEAFRTRYPSSLLWPMIAATLDAPAGSSR
jgi:hypothetical protein